jgi:hypothetical protein
LNKVVVPGLIVAVGLAVLATYLFLKAPSPRSQPQPQPPGQQPGEAGTWAKAIGGSKTDYAPSFQIENDGYILIGYSESFGAGSFDVFVVEIDENGGVLWSKTMGGARDDKAYTIQRTGDGGYIVAGYSYSFGIGGSDFLVIKLNGDRSVAWAKTINMGKDERAMGALPVPGGYLVAGSSMETSKEGSENIYAAGVLVKLDENGNFVFGKSIAEGTILGIIRTVDGGYAAVGNASGNIMIIKFDENCNVEWAKSVGGREAEYANWDGIRQTRDGGYAYACKLSPLRARDNGDFLAVKLDSNGNLEWASMLGGTGFDAGWTMNETVDGYIAGGTFGKGGEVDAGDTLVTKLDHNGNFLWARVFDGYGVQLDEIEEIKQVNGGYVMAGVVGVPEGTGNYGDFFAAKFNPDGTIPGSSNIHTLSLVTSEWQLTTPTSALVKSVTSELSATSLSLTLENISPIITSVTPTLTDVTSQTHAKTI